MISDRAVQKIRAAKYKIDSVFYRSFEKLSKTEKEEFTAASKILNDLASEIEKEVDKEFEGQLDWNKGYLDHGL
jgi:hypothetical protein